MNGVSKLVFADKIIKWGLLISAILLLTEVLAIGIFYFSLPPLVPIFNQMPWGDDRLGAKIEIFIPFFLTLVFFVMNYFILTRLYERVPLLSRMLSITTFLVSLLSFFFIIKTLQLII